MASLTELYCLYYAWCMVIDEVELFARFCLILVFSPLFFRPPFMSPLFCFALLAKDYEATLLAINE